MNYGHFHSSGLCFGPFFEPGRPLPLPSSSLRLDFGERAAARKLGAHCLGQTLFCLHQPFSLSIFFPLFSPFFSSTERPICFPFGRNQLPKFHSNKTRISQAKKYAQKLNDERQFLALTLSAAKGQFPQFGQFSQFKVNSFPRSAGEKSSESSESGSIWALWRESLP